jgi:hypothetical protein
MIADAKEGTETSPFMLDIMIRAYAEEVTPVDTAQGSAGDATEHHKTSKRREPPQPSDWVLCFDTETTTCPAQRFKVGFYRLYERSRLEEEALFYDAPALSEADCATVAAYAEARGLPPPISLEQFRKDVLIGRGFDLGATIVTFNGPFDFSRIALDAGPARATSWRRKMQGGFSLKLTDRSNHPAIQIKPLNPRAALVECTAPRRQETSRSRRKQDDYAPVFRGFFVDVKTLAAALTARSHSLESLTKALKTPTQKVRSGDHGQALDFAYLDYARDDVAATWESYRALIDTYAGYGLEAPAHTIISEAGIGKAALDTMGIKPWAKIQPGGIDPALTSLILSTYFGGRTEVRIRRKIVQVLHTDFMSMYPTVCTLQGLWRFVIGTGFAQADATAQTRAFLETVTPADFQDQATWKRLATLVRIKPDRDLLPIRTTYGDQKHATIGLNHLTYGGDLWVTLADCIAAKFLSGKAPRIGEAIAFTPGPPQAGLESITLLGRHTIDPYERDFYRELIRARQDEEARKHNEPQEEHDAIDEVRQALKITANATSYGIFVQLNVNSEPRGAPVRVHRPDGSSFVKTMKKVETPGPWFNPLVGTLITGGARLMLALAERKAMDAGLDWAFCDTDSLAIARPEGMTEADFYSRADSVVDWFAALNPYGTGDSILKVEKANLAADGSKRRAPLYCFAISSKRYALFNVGADGGPIIRKASAHGLGHLIAPYGDDQAPAHIPLPLKEVISGKEKLQRWHYDAWFAILSSALDGKAHHVKFDYHSNLLKPTVSRYNATSPDILSWVDPYNAGKSYADQIKPCGFLYLLHPSTFASHPDAMADPLVTKGKAKRDQFPIAPFDTDLDKAIAGAFDRISGEPIDASRLQTYQEALLGYPFRSEPKFLNGEGYDTGRTERCHVHACAVQFIGKEADRWEEEHIIGNRLGETAIAYGVDPLASARIYDALRTGIAAVGKTKVAAATGIARTTLNKIERGEGATTAVPLGRVHRALEKLMADRSATERERLRQRATLIEMVSREGGIRAAARKLGVDASNLRRILIE